jgi:hypothetical protein
MVFGWGVLVFKACRLTADSVRLLLLHASDVHLEAIDGDTHVLKVVGRLVVLVRRVEQGLE